MEFRNTLPSAGAPTKIGMPSRLQVESKPGLHAIALFLLAVVSAQAVSQLSAGHLLLEFRARQHRGQKLVLIEQHRFIEAHIRDADHAFVAQLAVIAEDRNFVNRVFGVLIQAAMAVVITDRIRRAEVSHPTGFEQRNQPRLMLPRNGDRARNRNRQRTSHRRSRDRECCKPGAELRRRKPAGSARKFRGRTGTRRCGERAPVSDDRDASVRVSQGALFDAEIPDLRVELAFGVLDDRVLALRERILRPDFVEPVIGKLLGEDLNCQRSSIISFDHRNNGDALDDPARPFPASV